METTGPRNKFMFVTPPLRLKLNIALNLPGLLVFLGTNSFSHFGRKYNHDFCIRVYSKESQRPQPQQMSRRLLLILRLQLLHGQGQMEKALQDHVHLTCRYLQYQIRHK